MLPRLFLLCLAVKLICADFAKSRLQENRMNKEILRDQNNPITIIGDPDATEVFDQVTVHHTEKGAFGKDEIKVVFHVHGVGRTPVTLKVGQSKTKRASCVTVEAQGSYRPEVAGSHGRYNHANYVEWEIGGAQVI